MLTVRRISAAFKDIPGGQILGPSLDYSHRILRLDLLDDDNPAALDEVEAAENPAPPRYPLVADWLRQQGLLAEANDAVPEAVEAADIPDVTREPITIPAPRAHRLQSLARADTGGVLALGYASMRGYGFIHPTVNELRLAYAEVTVKHPASGQAFSVGRVRVSQGEIVSSSPSGYKIGFVAVMGWNEVKLIAGATLDLEMTAQSEHAALTEDFILYHTEPIESSGFCIHFKLPHYVTFSSSTDNVRKMISVLYGADAAGEDNVGRNGTGQGQPAPEAVSKDVL